MARGTLSAGLGTASGEDVILGNGHHPLIGYGVPAGIVCLRIDSDLGSVRDGDILVDDSVAAQAVAADFDIIEED